MRCSQASIASTPRTCRAFSRDDDVAIDFFKVVLPLGKEAASKERFTAALAKSLLEGTDLVVFTDQTGSYRLTGVPSGPTVLEVFFTGLDPLQLPVTIRAGDVVDQDISLTNSARYGTDASGTVKLDSFVVATARETDSAAWRTQRLQTAMVHFDFGWKLCLMKCVKHLLSN